MAAVAVKSAPVHLRRLLALVALALAFAGCGAAREGQGQGGAQGAKSKAPKADVTIDMRNIQFLPKSANVKVGDTVLWTNSDSVAHTVTKRSGPGPKFDSGPIKPGGTYTRTFKQAGKIDYLCTIHPNQTGTLTVK